MSWLPDSHTDVCMMCKTSFDLLIRRHHCRKCGQIYCGGCCSNYMKLPLNMIISAPGFDRSTIDPSLPVRCCNKCKVTGIRPIITQEQQQQVQQGQGQRQDLVEVNALEIMPGDHYKRYMVMVPMDIRRGQTFRVSLDGRLMTVLLPENVLPGDAIYVRAPIFTSVPTRASATTIKRKVDILACSKCTYENNPAFPNCQMCGNDLNYSKDAVINTPKITKVNVLELNEGEPMKQYYVIIPFNVNSDEVFQVSLDGRIMSVLCPENARGGDKIIVVGPDPEFLPPADASELSSVSSNPLTEADIVIAHHKAALMEFLKNPPSHMLESEFIDILLASGLTDEDVEIAKRNWNRKKEKEATERSSSTNSVINLNDDNTCESYDDEEEIKENDQELKVMLNSNNNNNNNDENDKNIIEADIENEEDVKLALKESLSLKQERPLEFHAHLFTKLYDEDDEDDDEVKIDLDIKSIFDVKKNNKSISIKDRQKSLSKIKEDVDNTVISFIQKVEKANENMNSNDNMKAYVETDIDYICCQQCTFHNSLTAIDCNMCGMTLETTTNKVSNNIKKVNKSEPVFASAVATASQLPPTCIVESILRDDDDNDLPIDGAIVDFPIQCTVCTLDNHPGSKICEACGHDLSTNNDTNNNYQRIAQTTSSRSSSAKKKSKKNNNNNNNEYIPEAVVIPISTSSNGLNGYPIEAFPIDNNNNHNNSNRRR